MAIIAENNMVTFISKDRTLTGFCFTKHIRKYTHIENGYTLMFQLDNGTEDFLNLLDVADELGIEPLKPNEKDLFMETAESISDSNELFSSCDMIIDKFAIWNDIAADNVALRLIYLENPTYMAIMIRLLNHIEVSSSNMPLDILYRMKFIVERNEKLLTEEWKRKKFHL